MFSVVALLLSVVSLLAVGALGREIGFRKERSSHGDLGTPQPFQLDTLGKPVEQLLRPLITMPPQPDTPGGSGSDPEVVTQDAFLLDDGPVLIVSTRCSSCVTLLQSLADSPEVAMGLRVVLVAPDLKEGIDFSNKHIERLPTVYQIDEEGRKAAALGAGLTPVLLSIENGALATAHGVLFADHIAAVIPPRPQQRV